MLKVISKSAINEAILIDGSEKSKQECFECWGIPIDSWFIYRTENSICIKFQSKNNNDLEYELIGKGNTGYLINANTYYQLSQYIDVFFFVDKDYLNNFYIKLTDSIRI